MKTNKKVITILIVIVFIISIKFAYASSYEGFANDFLINCQETCSRDYLGKDAELRMCEAKCDNEACKLNIKLKFQENTEEYNNGINQCSEAYLSEIKEYQTYQEKVKEANKDNKVFKYNIPIGGETQFTINDSNRGRILGNFFNIWYGMLMGAIGVVATFMIAWGGFQYLSSRGDSTQIGNAKNNIISAITGLILAFTSYLILSVISPNLLVFKDLNLTTVEGVADGKSDKIPKDPNENLIAPRSDDITSAINDPDLTGTTQFVDRMNYAVTSLQASGKLPAGFDWTSGYRPEDGDSYHAYGIASDATWPGITQQSAEAFAEALREHDPGLSIIIETNGENGSTWRQYGMGIHIDARSTPYYER